MNLELTLDIPLTSTTSSRVVTQVLLEPYYCTEDDILNPFEEFDSNNSVYVRSIIFNASLRVYNETIKIARIGILSPEDLLFLQRDYTICIATADFTKKLKVDYLGTISRMKKLGDFQVQTSNKTDGTIINKLLKDTEDCIKECKQLIKDIESERVLPQIFAKGSNNPMNTQVLGRIWWLSHFNPHITDAYASTKILSNNNRYKVGNFNIYRGTNVSDTRIEPSDGTV
jgi:hypothetical protein